MITAIQENIPKRGKNLQNFCVGWGVMITTDIGVSRDRAMHGARMTHGTGQ